MSALRSVQAADYRVAMFTPCLAPIIETERLRLRAFTVADFDAHLAIMARPEVALNLGPPLTREDLWRRSVAAVGMWGVLGFGGLMAERKADGRIIGNVGLFDARRDLIPDFAGEPEAGWIFDPDTHGLGLAHEAAAALLGWLDAAYPPVPVWAIISIGNEPSFRLAERLGFERLDDSVYHDEPIAVLRRPARTA